VGENDMASRLIKLAKNLRNNPTIAEDILWNRLRSRQVVGSKFRRQQPIDRYIVDFVSFEKRMIIELDGGQHAKNAEEDERRDRFFEDQGYKVLRFWNNAVFENLEGVLEVIRQACLK
jgi:very-short-patch-repair endonuclease